VLSFVACYAAAGPVHCGIRMPPNQGMPLASFYDQFSPGALWTAMGKDKYISDLQLHVLTVGLGNGHLYS